MSDLLEFSHFCPEDVVPDVVPVVHSVPLAPLLVQELLELLVSHQLLVAVQDGDVEVGVVVTAVGLGLQKGLDLGRENSSNVCLH